MFFSTLFWRKFEILFTKGRCHVVACNWMSATQQIPFTHVAACCQFSQKLSPEENYRAVAMQPHVAILCGEVFSVQAHFYARCHQPSNEELADEFRIQRFYFNGYLYQTNTIKLIRGYEHWFYLYHVYGEWSWHALWNKSRDFAHVLSSPSADVPRSFHPEGCHYKRVHNLRMLNYPLTLSKFQKQKTRKK